MKDPDSAQRLVRLKRYETPGEEYFSSFMDEFKDRQRSEMLRRSSLSILAERVSVWFDEMHGAKWLVPAGAAAAIGIGVLVNVPTVDKNSPVQPILTGYAGTVNGATDSDIEKKEQEAIQLALPKRNGQIPTLESGVPKGSSNLLPAGLRGSIREL
tara:strand:- start:5186 stop:5653 length:468 start_codon:yes stop_codon:yes gene_type:complete